MDRRLFLGSGACATGILLLSGPALAQATPADYAAAFQDWLERSRQEAAYLPDVEASVLAATNERREEAGLPPVETDPELRSIARFYADLLAQGAEFAHEDAEGRSPADRIALLHRRLIGTSGENLFQSNVWRRSEPVRAGRFAVDSLMESPGHRENILRPDWTSAGMGVVAAGDLFYLVQLFADPAAMLARDLPLNLKPGAPLPPAATEFAEGGADRIAFADLGGPPKSADLQPLARARAPSTPGAYATHYAIRDGASGNRISYKVVPGPVVTVG